MSRLLVKMEWLLAFLLAVLLLFSAYLVRGAMREMDLANRYDYMERISGRLIKAAGLQALERGAGATIIGSADSPSAELLAIYSDNQKRGDEEVRQAMNDLNQLIDLWPNPDMIQSRDSLRSAFENLKKARARVLSGGISKTEWVEAATEGIEREFGIWNTMFAPDDPREEFLIFNSVTRLNVAMLCEYAGRERANIGNLIASHLPVSPDLLETLKSYRVIVDHAVRQMEMMKGLSTTPPKLAASLKEFDDEFMGSYQLLRERVYAASRDKRPYPVTATQWFSSSTKAIDSGLKISDVIGEQSSKAAADIRYSARRAILINLGLLISSVFVCIFVLFFVRRTIVIPINRTMKENARLAAAVTHAVDAVAITDPAGNIEYVNPAFERQTGYMLKEVLGKNMRILKSSGQDEAFYKNIWDTIKVGNVWRGQMVNRKKDGSTYEEEMTISPITDEAGKIVSYVAIKRDVTERNAIREHLIQSEKLATIGTFVSGVAHELNNPLTAIIGFSEELAASSGNVPEATARILGVIADQAKRTVKIVQSLLHFSRSPSQEMLTIDVTEGLRDIIALQHYPLRAGNITVKKNFSKEPLLVKGNEGQLQQVFLNVILNAVHEMKKANGKGVLSVTAERRNDAAVITFENDGPSIPANVIGRLFDPFFTTKGAGEGTGLGLSIAYGIMERHGGRIWAENTGNHGVRFVVSLPYVKSEAYVPDEKTKQDGIDISDLRVLIVEDEEYVAEWISTVLKRRGARVHTASNGKEAVQLCGMNRYDLVVSDVDMPEMNGFEFLKWWNLNRQGSRGRFILTTGSVDKEADDFCAENSAEILKKPFGEEDLMAVIQKAVDPENLSVVQK